MSLHKKITLTFFTSLFFLALNAQSLKLSGKVTNSKNELLTGASVSIAGTNTGTTTNLDGIYILNLTIGKKYEIQFSAIGYETKNISDVEVINSQTNELNITLEIKVKTGDNIIISAKAVSARKETIASGIAFQKNTNTVAQVVTAEAIRRSPDKNTWNSF